MSLINASDIETVETQAAAAPPSKLDLLCAGHSVSDKRRESLQLAIDLGADEPTLAKLRDANRLARQNTVVLPQGRYAHCSRGKSWCRKGTGSDVEWADRDEHRVGPGKWYVGSDDGFSRKERPVLWVVEHVQVGEQTWTIAN